MITVKAILRKKPNSVGELPLAIRITKDRKSSYTYTGIYIVEKEWDKATGTVKKSNPNSARLNNFIRAKLNEAMNLGLQLYTDQTSFNATTITKTLKSATKVKSFFRLADLYLSNLDKNQKFNQYSADAPRIKHFKIFLKGQDIDFRDLTVLLLKQFSAWLKAERQISDRTIVNHLVVIRTIFNLAIRDELVESKYYPFGRGKIIIKFPQSIKLGLTIEEVRRMEALELSDTDPKWHARNLWLISFYFAGMRISDVLKIRWKDIADNRLHYVMGKNNKSGSLPISNNALEIFKRYQSKRVENSEYIFPELQKADSQSPEDIHRKVKNGVHALDKQLKNLAILMEFTKPLTMHIARHTFGNLSGDIIPIQMLQKLYRHSSVTTTINYQSNFIFKDEDEALNIVLNQ